MFKTFGCIRVSPEGFLEDTHDVVEEIPITLNVNGRHAATAMTSPDRLEDFAIGYLYTEQIIRSYDEIESLRIEKNIISVMTKTPFKVIGQKKIVLSGCGGGSSFMDESRLPKIQSNFVVSPAAISDAMKRTLDSELHKRTGGLHVLGLGTHDGQFHTAEDIGRHNALDRVAGLALRTGIDLSRTFVVSSGRISSEMVRKCLFANIPVIASRGSTTSLAVEAARRGGLTVIGFVRAGKMNIYSHAERVSGAPGIPEEKEGKPGSH